MPEAVYLVGIGGEADDDFSIPALHGTRGPAQRRNAACTSGWQVIQPPRCEPEMLRQSDSGIGTGRKAGKAEAVDIIRPETGVMRQLAQRLSSPPVGAFRREAHIRHCYRGTNGNAVIG